MALSRSFYALGVVLRETGQAMDRLGCLVMGNMAPAEQLSRHRTVMSIFEKIPNISPKAFIAPSASVIGDVTIGERSSVWYNSVVRGDVNYVKIGSDTNIQDGSVVHVSRSNIGGAVLPTIIGDRVTVGHSAVLHACTLEDESFIGMGASILDGAVVGSKAMIAAGALVTPGTKVPSGELWAGVPAKYMRKLSDEELAHLKTSSTNYAELGHHHSVENAKSFDEILADIERRKEEEERSEDYDSHLGIKRGVATGTSAS